MGNMCVVHPVAVLSAVVCIICSLLMFVSDANVMTIWWKRLEYASCHGEYCFILFSPCC